MDDPIARPAWPLTEDAVFATTQWTVIAEAARDGDAESARALAKLCEIYWLPVYAFIRRRGQAPEEAKDLTQGFFARLLDKKSFTAADRAKGKFRTYLLGEVKFYLGDEWRKGQRLKRGGDASHLAIDCAEVEKMIEQSAADHHDTPERIFDRAWADHLLDRTRGRLQREFVERGKAEHFEILFPLLGGTIGGASYRDIAERHGQSEASIKMAASRLRKRYGEILREEIAVTVDPDEVEAEIQYLMQLYR